MFTVPCNTKGGSITVLLTSCLTGLGQSVLQIKTKIVSCHTADSKPVKQEVNGTMILPPLVFPAESDWFLTNASSSLNDVKLKNELRGRFEEGFQETGTIFTMLHFLRELQMDPMS